MLKLLPWTSLVLVTVLTGSVSADERKFAWVNAVGRFLGVGGTKGGYHAHPNSQMPIVRYRHPADAYGSRHLMYPYQAGYQPHRAQAVTHPMPAMTAIPGGASNAIGDMPPQPEVPAQPPAGPPPAWIKPYLLDGQEGKPEELQSPAQAEAPQPKSAQESSPFEIKSDASPSDQLLDDDGDLLDDGNLLDEEKDDLLLLEADDLSLRPALQRGPQPQRHRRANRYQPVFGPR